MWCFHTTKRGDKEDADNYRPVCHLVEVGKLVEVVVWEQLMDYTTQRHLLHPSHHGSVPHHSISTVIVQVCDAVTCAADQKLLAAVVLLDQKAAFDLVDHQTLAAKMRTYGFADSMVDWLSSYLHSRRFVVEVGAAWSHPRPVGDQGVPQGSVLGSLLFILSQGDLPDVTGEECQEEGEGDEEGDQAFWPHPKWTSYH